MEGGKGHQQGHLSRNEDSSGRQTCREAVMFPRRAESSLTSTNYRREMTGMFKVNKMEAGVVDKV